MYKSILLTLTVVASVALAQESARQVFVNADLTPLYVDAEAADEAAQLRVSTALEVLDDSDDRTLVQVRGWVKAMNLDVGGPVYTNPFDLVEITPAAQAAVLTSVSATGEWHEVELRGWIYNDALVEDRADMFAAAAKLYQMNCTRCHAGYAGPVEALVARLKPSEWPQQATDMAVGTGISKSDLSLLIHWLQHQSQLAHENSDQ